MKVVFVSNYFNHHQHYFSEAMYQLIGDGYVFVETSQMRDERKKMGYEIGCLPSYVKKYNDECSFFECANLINNADVVIAGSAPEELLRYRKRHNKLLFRYQERLFRQELSLRKSLIGGLAWYIRNLKRKQIYLLCASAFTAADYRRLGLFENRSYKWGYFPQLNNYDITSLINQKDKTKILWCGRFLSLKHPEYALYVAERLKKEGYDFSIDYIGSGILEEKLKYDSMRMGLENHITFLGTMNPERVREYMEKAAIFMFTSNFEEGWGAVLNEAMNSGCAVVASHAIGSVPFLLKHKDNGLIYENENVDDLYLKVKYLLDHPADQKKMGTNAYRTIANVWNANVAAERFLELVTQIQKKGQCDLYDDGPCARAENLKNNWFKGEN